MNQNTEQVINRAKKQNKNFNLKTNRNLVKKQITRMLNQNKPGGKYFNYKTKPAFKFNNQGQFVQTSPIKQFGFIAVKENQYQDNINKQQIFKSYGSVGPSLLQLGKRINIPPNDLLKASENFKTIRGYTILRFTTQERQDAFFLNYLQNKLKQNNKLLASGLYNDTGRQRKELYSLNQRTDKINKKYNATETSFNVSFRGDMTMIDLQGLLKRLTQEIITNNNLNDNDKIRIIFQGATGAKLGSIPLTDVGNLDLDVDENSFISVIKDTYGLENDEISSKIKSITIIFIKNPNIGGGFQKNQVCNKRSVIQVKNDDNLCLGRCLVIANAMRCNHPMLKQIKMGRTIQTTLTHQLYKDAGIIEDIGDLDTIIEFEKHLDCCITIIDGDQFNNVIYPDIEDDAYEPKDFNIYLYKTKNHYDLINCNKVAGFFDKNYFCNRCKKCFSSKNKHKCSFKCNICCSTDCDCIDADFSKIKEWKGCDDCFRFFPSDKCFSNHIKEDKKGNCPCNRVWKCRDCKKIINREDQTPEQHTCGDYKCRNCNKMVSKDHKCYMMPTSKTEPSEKYIFFDFEATQDTGSHIVNLSVSKYFDDDEPIIHYDTKSFCEWLFSKDHKDYTIIAHNGKGYDYQFIMKWIYEETSYKPFVVYAGSKIMTFSIKSGLNIRFVDSVNFLPMPLESFPKTFGIKELKKGYYPHYFNTAENINYVGIIPDAKYFGCDDFKVKKRNQFLDWWYEKRKNNYVWDNKKELLEYCISDVDILKRSLVIFRKLYISISAIDPLQYTTIASVCMAIFRRNFLLPEYKDIMCDDDLDDEEQLEKVRDLVFSQKKIAMMSYEDQQFIRGSFFGGRTNATSLLYNFKEGEVGKYVDITSLYPTTNFYDFYGKGHLKTIDEETLNEFLEKEKYIEKVKNKEYNGFIMCDIIPPNDLYIPVLPEKQQTWKTSKTGKKSKDSIKLVFDLLEKKGTWTTMEIYKALEKGYKIKKLYCIKYYEEIQYDLFKGYVSSFLKIKQEASGFPDWVCNDKDKKQYIKEYNKNQGILLDINKIKYNPGLRAIAKLCLNSLWGKFGMRLDLPITEITTDKKRFNNLIFNPKYKDQDLFFIDDERVEIKYKVVDEKIPLNPNTNIGIASFTTSHARLRLFEGLDYLQEQVLYNDTDSIVYRYDKNNPNHKNIEIGDYLGDWTDELEGVNMIGTFASGGPKNYSYETDDGVYHTKVKGFNLNYNASQIIKHDSMIEIIKNRHKERDENNLKVEKFSIIRKSNKDLVSIYETKQYSFGYDKRHIQPEDEYGNIFTLPFGHKNI